MSDNGSDATNGAEAGNASAPALEWHRVLAVEELPEGRVATVGAGHKSVALVHYDGEFSALDNHCPHQGGPLGEGSIENGLLRCPWHGFDYCPLDGKSPGFDDEATGRRANYGFSPGDADHREPYIYVGPWRDDVAGELWNATGFAGAELGYAELLGAEDQTAAALDFCRARREALESIGPDRA